MGGGHEPPPLQPIIDRGHEPPFLLHRRWGLKLLLLLPHPAPLVVGPPVTFVWQGREPPPLQPLGGRVREPPPLQPLDGRGREQPPLQPLDGRGREQPPRSEPPPTPALLARARAAPAPATPPANQPTFKLRKQLETSNAHGRFSISGSQKISSVDGRWRIQLALTMSMWSN